MNCAGGEAGTPPRERILPDREPRVIREHADWLVVDKPAHVLVHPTRPDGQPSLLGWLQQREPGGFFALVNRLDRETSGLVLVARHAEAASALGRQMMNRQIGKSYEAIVWGRVTWQELEVDQPLGRIGLSDENPIYCKQGILSGGAPSHTRFRVLATGDSFTHVQAEPRSGRLHQIRVHLAFTGHPVVGDKIYGPDPLLYLKFIEHGWTAEHEKKLLLNHHALHAGNLEFTWEGERIGVSSELPTDLQRFLIKSGLALPQTE